MGPICMAPIVMIGALFTLHPYAKHQSDRDAAYIEAQTCRTGFGAHALASTTQFYSWGIQYGLDIPVSRYLTLTIQPVFGGSYTARADRQLPMGAQFETGVNLIASGEEWIVGVKWLHASNAGLKQPNIGVDWMGVFVGRRL